MKNTILVTTLISGAVLGLSACGGGGGGTPAFNTFDGKWDAPCIDISSARSFDQILNISGASAFSDVAAYTGTGCTASSPTELRVNITFSYEGETDVSAICATGKAEKVNATIDSVVIGGGTITDPAIIQTAIAGLGVNAVPAFNLLCLDGSGNLRTGDVSGALDGSTDAKRPTEMDATNAGFIKL